jgi:hypothetical protein
MSTTQTLLAVAAAVFLLLFMTGTMGVFADFIDLGVAVRDLPYVLALPATAVFTLYMLRV